MKNLKLIFLAVTVTGAIIITSSFTGDEPTCQSSKTTIAADGLNQQMVNLFVSHGHCSLPFAGEVNRLELTTVSSETQKNPLEDMTLAFEIDPSTFYVCRGEDLTERVQTPGLFADADHDKIYFKSTSVYTMGLDWYQINGNLTIKGIDTEVKLFATGIRDIDALWPSVLVVEAQFNLFDWGIDYDKIVNGESNPLHASKWMHLNMTIPINIGC